MLRMRTAALAERNPTANSAAKAMTAKGMCCSLEAEQTLDSGNYCVPAAGVGADGGHEGESEFHGASSTMIETRKKIGPPKRPA